MDLNKAIQELVHGTIAAAMPQIIAVVKAELGAPANPLLATTGAATVNTVSAPAVTPAPATIDPFASLGVTAAPTPVADKTPQDIQELIMPLVSNDTIKAALAAEMHAMGIGNLPDIKPEQLNEAYNRFAAVRDKFTGGATTPAPTASAAVSII